MLDNVASAIILDLLVFVCALGGEIVVPEKPLGVFSDSELQPLLPCANERSKAAE